MSSTYGNLFLNNNMFWEGKVILQVIFNVVKNLNSNGMKN